MNRYQRQIALEGWSTEGQARMQRSRVAIVGVGGLGSPISLYLAAAGVGSIGLIDNDTVSLNNLQRQVLYTEDEIGESKAVKAAEHLRRINSTIIVKSFNSRLDQHNYRNLLDGYDIVIDGCDNFSTRHLIAKYCEDADIPYIYGAIHGFEGQVSIFHPSKGTIRYSDLYPQTESLSPEGVKAIVPDNSVAGTTPAVVGSIMANEAIKLIVGVGEPLIGKLWTIDLRNLETDIINF